MLCVGLVTAKSPSTSHANRRHIKYGITDLIKKKQNTPNQLEAYDKKQFTLQINEHKRSKCMLNLGFDGAKLTYWGQVRQPNIA